MDTYPIDTEEATRVNIRTQALINDAFLRVIHTGPHEQIVVMTLPLDGESGEKVSPDTDQFFVFVDGLGEARVGAYVLGVEPGDLIYVPAGTRCNIVNRAVAPLRLIAVYGPPALEPGAIYWTRRRGSGAAPWLGRRVHVVGRATSVVRSDRKLREPDAEVAQAKNCDEARAAGPVSTAGSRSRDRPTPEELPASIVVAPDLRRDPGEFGERRIRNTPHHPLDFGPRSSPECSTAEPTVAALGAALRDREATYNTVRPHQALGYLTPAEYLASLGVEARNSAGVR